MSKFIRQACAADVSRIAEILVFNNRINYYPIFRSDAYSFGELQVVPMANSFLADPELMARTFVYDDGIIRGVLVLCGDEVEKLYVDPCFQGQGIGAALIRFAVEQRHATHLWALEKNTGALRFYARHGFRPDGEKKFEEDTTEYLLHLRLQPDQP